MTKNAKVFILSAVAIVVMTMSCQQPEPAKATWNVAFDANGGSGTMNSATVTDGTSFTVPKCAYTLPGSGFRSWNTQPGGDGTSYDVGDSIASVTENITLYAQWGAIRTISFDANGGAGVMADESVGNGGTYVVPSCSFTQAGHTFGSWNTQADGLGTSYNPGNSISNVTANIALFAIWIPGRTISFDANQGSGTMDPVVVQNGNAYTIKANTFTRPDYTFVHWNTQANDLGTTYLPGATIPNVTSDIALYAIWVANWKVMFNPNGGSGTMPNATVADHGSYTVPENTVFTRTGYSFVEWNSLANGSGTHYLPGATITNITSDTTLYAIWSNSRTISFNANGGTGNMAPATVANGGSYLVPANGFTRAGYSLLRWNTQSDGGGTSYSPGDTISSVQADFTLYVQWIADRTITFNANGGSGTMSPNPGAVVYNGTYTVPVNTFTRTGYSFLRWNTQSNGSGTSYSPGASIANVTTNVTLYAQWIANHSVSFNANGGTGTMTPGTVVDGGSYVVPGNGFTLTGYSLLRWNTLANGSGTTYYPGDTISNVTSDITLYAIWIANRVVTLDSNGGTGTMPNGSVVYGGTYAVPSNGFSRSGYVFDRWNTRADGNGTSYASGASISGVTSDFTLYAQWIANRTISYNANGGTGSMPSAVILDGSTYTVLTHTFTRSNYTFSHWNTMANGGGTSYADGQTFTVTGDVTLYAIWLPITVQVSFVVNNPNEGTGSMASVPVTRGENYTAPACGFTRFPFAFTGWNTQANGGGTTYLAGAAISNLQANLTLYAQWALRPGCLNFIGFEDGSTLSQLALAGGIVDPSSSLSIQSTRAEFGSALRQNLGALSRLSIPIDGTAGYQDLWLMFDVYVDSTDYFPADTYQPLIIAYDATTDLNPGYGLPSFFGIPLHKDSPSTDYQGFTFWRPITNLQPSEIFNLVSMDFAADPPPLMGSWHNIKIHIKTDNTMAGVDIYIDKTLRRQTIADRGQTPGVVHFNAIRFWHHGDVSNEANNVFPAPNSNLFFDNIGFYSSDPDL